MKKNLRPGKYAAKVSPAIHRSKREWRQEQDKELADLIRLWKKGPNMKEFAAFLTGRIVRPEFFYILAVTPFGIDQHLKEIARYDGQHSRLSHLKLWLRKK